MFTPQQIEQISFGRATFGGYDMQAVDEFLEPLTEDYVTLYKENALLKSKMRVLVGKLEEYRKNEASMKDAVVNAQKTCDVMVKEANAAARDSAKNADSLIEAEQARVEEAKKAATARIEELQEQIRACLLTLEDIKNNYKPAAASTPFDYERSEQTAAQQAANTAAVADEISANLQALVGTADEPAPKAEPLHPVSDTTSKFANLQFGRNYDPSKK